VVPDPLLTGESIEGCALVLFGSFNPQIFRLPWLRRFEVFDQDLLKAVEVLIDAPELVSLTFGDEIALEVSPERFLLHRASPMSLDYLVKRVSTIFTELPHTPIRVIAISLEYHFAAGSIEAQEQFLDRFVPLGGWHLAPSTGVERRLNLEVPGEHGETIRYELSKSDEFEVGIYLGIVHEYETAESVDEPVGAVNAMSTLISVWPEVLKNSSKVVSKLVGDE
jgi:hypothetical protein